MSALGDLFNAAIDVGHEAAVIAVGGTPTTRTQNASPAPDLTAKAATPGATVLSSGMGVATPLLVLGAVLIIVLIVGSKRR